MISILTSTAFLPHDDLRSFRHAELSLARMRIPALSLFVTRAMDQSWLPSCRISTPQDAVVFCALAHGAIKTAPSPDLAPDYAELVITRALTVSPIAGTAQCGSRPRVSRRSVIRRDFFQGFVCLLVANRPTDIVGTLAPRDLPGIRAGNARQKGIVVKTDEGSQKGRRKGGSRGLESG